MHAGEANEEIEIDERHVSGKVRRIGDLEVVVQLRDDLARLVDVVTLDVPLVTCFVSAFETRAGWSPDGPGCSRGRPRRE